MADQRRGGIAWTEETLNPIRARHRATGKVGWYCQRVSEGCKHCYAATMNEWRGNGVDYTVPALKEVELVLDEKILTAPLRWRRPRRVFLCSMTDLFADFVPDAWIDRIFAVMALCPQHRFQVLTKRPERMFAYLSAPDVERRVWTAARLDPDTHDDLWPLPSVWLGVSVEDQSTGDARIPLLLQTPAAVRWVSYEPALGPVNFTSVGGWRPLAHAEQHLGLDWLVIGGESGPSARPFDLAWARRAIAQCRAAGIPVFCKQLGAFPVYSEDGPGEPFGPGIEADEPIVLMPVGTMYHRLKLKDRKGADWNEWWFEDLRVREWPQ